MKEKILFVLTSHGTKGKTREKTGYHLAEASHPWEVLTKAGYEIDFVSPQGGNPPVDAFDLSDPINREFWEDPKTSKKVANSMKPSEVDASEYKAIYYAGGHGAMWDLPDNMELRKITTDIYENNGVVAAVCHGPAGLVNVKLSDGSYLVDGKNVNSFTDEEEKAAGMGDIVPFLLETQIKERGGIFEKSGIQEAHVVTDGRLITGQNPASATGVGEAIVAALK